MLLQDLDNDRDGRVDGVGDDADNGFWCRLGDASSKIAYDAGVDLCSKPR